ncbi:MAG: hypothetical protein ACQSGP_05305 [Frankia sp.]
MKLQGIEEDAEEHQDDYQQDLRFDTETEGQHEHRPEDDAGDRIQHLNVGAEYLGEEADSSERDPSSDAQCGADEKADQRFLQGDHDLVAQGTDRGSVADPGV